MLYDRVGVIGKGGSSKVYSVICPTKRIIYALKRVLLDRADAETYQSYTNEIELLKRLRGHDRIIQLMDHQITHAPNGRPKVLMMARFFERFPLIADHGMRRDRFRHVTRRATRETTQHAFRWIVLGAGEYYKSVFLMLDVAGCPSCPPGECCAHGSQAGKLCSG